MRGRGGGGHSFSGKRCLMFQPALKRQTSTVKTVEVKRLASTPDSITVDVYGWCINLCAFASTMATRWRSAVSGTCLWVGKGGIIIPHPGICPDSLESRSAHSFVVKRSLREQFFVLRKGGGGQMWLPSCYHPQAQSYVGCQQGAAPQQQEEADQLAFLAVRHHVNQRGLQQGVHHPLTVQGEARHRVHHR